MSSPAFVDRLFGQFGTSRWFYRGLLLFCFAYFSGPAIAQTTVTQVYSGITRHDVNRSLNGRSSTRYQVMIINLLDPNVSFIMTPPVTSGAGETVTQTTRNFASQYTTDVAVNVHYFEALAGGRSDLKSFAASGGVAFSPFERTQPGHTFALNFSADNFAETVAGNDGEMTFTTTTSPPFNTLGFFPILYRGGVLVGEGSALFRARTQVGTTRDGATLFLLASTSGMTEKECAEILVNEFGAYNVYGLDGGGSTTMVLRTGTTTQSIIAIESVFGERSVGSNLGVKSVPAVSGIPEIMSWDADPAMAGIQQGGGVWDFAGNRWQDGGLNRTWANPKTPLLGDGGGSLITLGGRIGVRNMTVGGGYTIGSPSGPKFVALGNLTANGATPTIINAPLGESTGFRKMGPQTLQIGTSSRVSFLELTEGTVDLGGNTLTFLDPFEPLKFSGGTLQNGTVVLTVEPSVVNVVSGNLSLSTGLTAQAGFGKSGAGNLTLAGTASLSGPLVIREGRLDLGSSNSTVTTFTIGGASATSASLAMGFGTLTLGGTLTYDAAANPDAATLSGRIDLGGNRIFVVGDSSAAVDDLVVPASLVGAFNLTKNGPGRLVLSGVNEFNTLNVFEGSVRCDIAGAIPTGKAVAVRAATLDLNGFDQNITTLTLGNTSGFSEVETGSGNLTMTNLTYSSTNNGTGARVRGKLNLGSSTRTFTVNDSSNAAPDTLIEASITAGGSAGFTKAGAGRLDLGGALTIPGTFTVNNGELRLTGLDVSLGAVTLGGIAGGQPILDTGAAILSPGGNLTYTATNNGLGAIVRGQLNTGSTPRILVVNDSSNAAVDLRIEAIISGSGGISKTGNGTLELAGANEFSGNLTCSAGTTRLAHASALGEASVVNVSSGATLHVQSLALGQLAINRPTLSVIGSGSINGSVALSQGRLAAETGSLSISGNFVATGGTTEVTVGTGAGTLAVTGTVQLGGRLVVKIGGSLASPQSIPIITGSSISGNFSEVQLPTAPQGTVYSIQTTSTEVRLVATAGTPLQAWLTCQNVPTNTVPTDDLDGDSHEVLVEYALGGSALNPDSALATVSLEESQNRLQISFLWNTAATDLNAAVRASGDLISWSTILEKSGSGPWTGSASFTDLPASGDLRRVTVTDPQTGERRFLRVRITKP